MRRAGPARWTVLLGTLLGLAVLGIAQPPEVRLVNAGGEDDGAAGEDNGSPFVALTGWTAVDGDWRAQQGGWYDIPAVEGRRFIRPAPGPGGTAEQVFAVPQGRRYVVFRGWLRGWADGDRGSLRLAFDVGEPVESEAVSERAWREVILIAAIPAGATHVRAQLRAVRAAGNDCDAYFDDLRLRFAEAPPVVARIAVDRPVDAPYGALRFRDDSLGEVTGRRWEFGDGGGGDQIEVVHQFAEAGPKTVRLTVRGAAAEDTTTLTVDVDPLRIIKGPYLQHVTQDAVTVAWETNYPADSTLLYTDGTGVERAVGERSPKTLHQVRIEGASPWTRATYRVRSRLPGAEVVSTPGTFKTAPPRDTPFRLAAWGCNHVNPPVFSRLVERMMEQQPDLAWALGDVVDTGADYAEWERGFFGPLRPLIQSVPLMVSIGNHEGNHPWFYRFLDQPGNEHYFGFDYANAHFTIVDSNAPFEPGSEQYRFIEADLGSAAALAADWRFVGHHHPPWSEIYEEEHYQRLREQLVPLYTRLGVDVLLTAHIHDYERGSLTRPDGGTMWYVQTSGAGGRLWQDEFDGDWEAVAKVIQYQHHFSLLAVDGRNLRFQAIDRDGQVIDSFEATSGGPRRD